MKIISFNVNGIRSRLHQVTAVIKKHNPDVIGVQEIKVQDADFPVEKITEMGYYAEFFGQKTHYGVALFSKEKPLKVQKGFSDDSEDAQKRVICGEYNISGKTIYVINGYFPQGESRNHKTKFPAKEKYYQNMIKLSSKMINSGKDILVIGDMNISPTDLDIGIGEDNAKRWLRKGKCSFLPEEREWMKKLIETGLSDTYRIKNPEKNYLFSWFDYRSFGFQKDPKRGLRIDLIMASENLMKRCIDTGIDYEIRAMEKPSDHCPVWAEFE